jgi:hypothetical protein
MTDPGGAPALSWFNLRIPSAISYPPFYVTDFGLRNGLRSANLRRSIFLATAQYRQIIAEYYITAKFKSAAVLDKIADNFTRRITLFGYVKSGSALRRFRGALGVNGSTESPLLHDSIFS